MNLLVLNDYGIEGAGTENRLRLLLTELKQKNYFENIHVVHAYWQHMDEKIDGIYNYYCPRPKDTLRIVKNLINETKINIIQIHNFHLHKDLFLKYVLKTKIPLVWFAHDYWAFCGRRNLVPIYEEHKYCKEIKLNNCLKCIGLAGIVHLKKIKKILNKSMLGIAPSRYVIELHETEEILVNKWKLIKPWVDIGFLSSVPFQREFDNTILFVGPLASYKGAAVIARALKIIKEQIPDVHLKFVGPEQQEHSHNRYKIVQILKNDKTLENVEFLGYLTKDNLKQEYYKSTIYVCPPIWPEVFGLTWAEAMACGCVVVASNIGSIPEISSKKVILFEPGNHLELASKIIHLLKNKEKLKDNSICIRDYAINSFKVEGAALELYNLYKGINEENSLIST